MHALREESRNCPVLHRKQLGVTATRHQEHQYAPKISCAFWGWKYAVKYAVKISNQTNQHHELQDREPSTRVLWNLQKPACPHFFPRPGAKEGQELPNTGKVHVSEHMTLGYHCVVNNVVLLCCCNQEGNASCYQSLESEEDFFFKAWTNWELSAVSVTKWNWSESQPALPW